MTSSKKEAAVTGTVKVESTKAKMRFGQLEDRAESKDVIVTDHGRRKFVVIAPRRYDALLAIARVGKDRLQQLDEEFQVLVAGMQGKRHAKAAASLASRPLSEILARGAMRADPRKAAVRVRKLGSGARRVTRP